jgi:AcrR family transcriptional regulator
MTGMADKRIRMTKRMLAEQLIEAASVRDFDDISISEICEKAGVSRVTFYKY